MARSGSEKGQPCPLSDAAFSHQCADAFSQLFMRAREHFDAAFADLGLTPPCGKALRVIETSMSMKELAARLHCDGSFVTSIADALEERGLARREIDPNDRRIKNLVLTPEGEKVRDRVQELFERFPGAARLNAEEREAFLRMLQKMVAPEPHPG